MLDTAEVLKQIGYALDIGYWLIDLEHGLVHWPKGLGRPADVVIDHGYQAAPLDKMIARIAPADQGRFRRFLGDILAGRQDETIEVTHLSSWGKKVRLRMAGRQVGTGREAKVIGLVEVIERWRLLEQQTRNLSFIVEALFISADSGIILFDDQLKIRRLNRNTLDLFGVTDKEEERGDWASIIEKRLPKSTRDLLLEAIANSSAVTGNLTLGGLGGPRLTWRANPWGEGGGEMSGLVMTLNAKRQIRAADLAEHETLRAAAAEAAAVSIEPTLPPAPVVVEAEGDARHRALEWVKHPILLVSIASGEIAFANRGARDYYHLPADKRCFVENVYDVSGFTCDVDALAITAAGGYPLRLRLGARVGRMLDYDADLLFVEYHDTVPHIHPRLPMRVEAAKAAVRPDTGKPVPRPSPVVARPGAR